MKARYTVLIVSAFLCSSVVSASGRDATIDTSEKPSLKGSRGMLPKQDLRSLPRQKTVFPGKMTPFPERARPSSGAAIPAQ